MQLEQLQTNAAIRGILPEALVTVVSVAWFGSEALELTYKTPAGKVANELLYRHDEPRLELVEQGRPWSFDGDGALFRLVSEAHRIRLAHLFDPVLAVHTSMVDPLPHQITAVYEAMLPRQPLRFLLADDPGAGKTIMAGLLIKELIARGDLQRCLIVCPGSLAEQWQDELYRRFHLPFEILTNDKLEAARTGNWFLETNLAIARLDKLSRNEEVQQKLEIPDCRWDLVVCDEAHKLSATVFGGEVKYTKRYKLGQLLSTLTRHFLLMSATPHNGKEADFQLFMALLDGDRFEGRFRDGVHTADCSDLMRRMVKESLLKFDGTPLFPKRIAYTVPYKLSDAEAALYQSVTGYVREEFNRAEALENDKRAGTVGFALTILQRRLASSPEAIYQSLRRRRERLESRLRELVLGSAGVPPASGELDAEDLEDLEDAPDNEVEAAEEAILDQATAARSMTELRIEIDTLRRLEAQALAVRRTANDTKWCELASLLGEVFTPAALGERIEEPKAPYGAGPIAPPTPSPHQKLVIFTEHRDTLNYLEGRITTLLGRKEAVVIIHGGIGREARLKVQESFKHDPEIQVLLATDAAGEGINLQRAHLMVNYDLPWNPNRLEQRFGRIHRIGQTEVCHLWNLVADDTREGDVYRKLLEKLEQARQALGGQVFDVLGKLQFQGKSLRELLIEAIRHGERPEVKAFLTTVLDTTLDRGHLQELIDERVLAHDAMDASGVRRIREDMERADARRLQPHYIESFFHEAFKRLGGTAKQREPRRYEISHVPAPVCNRDRLIGVGEPVLPRYERIAFDKTLVAPQGQPLAAFVCPGHPLLDAVIDLTLERNRDLLKRGTVLVDERDPGLQPRVLFYLEHAIQDAGLTRAGERRVVSKRMLYVERDADGTTRHVHYAPYLDYRPLAADEPGVDAILDRPECRWIQGSAGVPPARPTIEQQAQGYAIARVVPEHLTEVQGNKLDLIAKTEAAVKDRLTKEITYWDHRAEELKLQESAGKPNARLNSGEARKRADLLQGRLQKRLEDLKLEAQLSPLPPVVLGGLLVVPIGLIRVMTGLVAGGTPALPDTQASAARARAVVMDIERRLGFDPTDREFDKLGYDIESRVPGTGKLRFIEVKGRVSGAATITVTRNEILYSLNKPDDFILAIVEFLGEDAHKVHYLRQPFQREPDFGVTSVNYGFGELLARAQPPA
ncbi:RNA helicase [Candidatus Thiodictyon syntrophicum]|jgi:superfamily II DNA or RNA helicase|uniref:RNA helicase n=2 Tax=Candidatus Thiodictyon syntrophicum TaxID=1166950 RepID=A0A2K8U3X3_9GAMM|nr:RNA helicase [Candidatus Thiodictyon syntrophicum]